MAKNAARNLAQLRKNNKYDKVPIICNAAKECENEAVVIKGATAKRKKYCEGHYKALLTTSDIATQKVLNDIEYYKSLGLL